MWLSHKSIWMKASSGEICRLRYGALCNAVDRIKLGLEGRVGEGRGRGG